LSIDIHAFRVAASVVENDYAGGKKSTPASVVRPLPGDMATENENTF
jgi:hypothetical protein